MASKERGLNAAGFLADVLRGAVIGIAFIIPGFSGGSVAAILGIYEKMVDAVTEIFSQFKRSFLTLLPIAIGIFLGVVALLFPLKWALVTFPLPTASLFVGLAVGGLPTIAEKTKGERNATLLFSFFLPFLLAITLCFLPNGGEVDLFSLSFGGYLALLFVGFLASCALVVPGVSGSMLLLIFGYYNPLIQLMTEHLFFGRNLGVCLLVLGCAALGMAVGFLTVSACMKTLLKRHPRGTYVAILGFIIGSIPAVFLSTAKGAGLTLNALSSPWTWIACILLFAVGTACAYAFVRFVRKKKGMRSSP